MNGPESRFWTEEMRPAIRRLGGFGNRVEDATQNGLPDVDAVALGISFKLELKVTDGGERRPAVTPAQAEFGKLWADRGGVALCACYRKRMNRVDWFPLWAFCEGEPWRNWLVLAEELSPLSIMRAVAMAGEMAKRRMAQFLQSAPESVRDRANVALMTLDAQADRSSLYDAVRRS